MAAAQMRTKYQLACTLQSDGLVPLARFHSDFRLTARIAGWQVQMLRVVSSLETFHIVNSHLHPYFVNECIKRKNVLSVYLGEMVQLHQHVEQSARGSRRATRALSISSLLLEMYGKNTYMKEVRRHNKPYF